MKKERKKRLTSGKKPDRIYKLHRLAEERKGKSGWKPKKFLKKFLTKPIECGKIRRHRS